MDVNKNLPQDGRREHLGLWLCERILSWETCYCPAICSVLSLEVGKANGVALHS